MIYCRNTADGDRTRTGLLVKRMAHCIPSAERLPIFATAVQKVRPERTINRERGGGPSYLAPASTGAHFLGNGCGQLHCQPTRTNLLLIFTTPFLAVGVGQQLLVGAEPRRLPCRIPLRIEVGEFRQERGPEVVQRRRLHLHLHTAARTAPSRCGRRGRARLSRRNIGFHSIGSSFLLLFVFLRLLCSAFQRWVIASNPSPHVVSLLPRVAAAT